MFPDEVKVGPSPAESVTRVLFFRSIRRTHVRSTETGSRWKTTLRFLQLSICLFPFFTFIGGPNSRPLTANNNRRLLPCAAPSTWLNKVNNKAHPRHVLRTRANFAQPEAQANSHHLAAWLAGFLGAWPVCWCQQFGKFCQGLKRQSTGGMQAQQGSKPQRTGNVSPTGRVFSTFGEQGAKGGRARLVFCF